MTQTIQLPAGPCAEESHRPIPPSVSSPPAARGSSSALIIAEFDQERDSLTDTWKVVAFLLLAMVARSVITDQHTSHVEDASEPPIHVQSPKIAEAPDLIDLSTVGF